MKKLASTSTKMKNNLQSNNQGIYIEVEPWIWLYRNPEDFKLSAEQIKEKIHESIRGFEPLIDIFTHNYARNN